MTSDIRLISWVYVLGSSSIWTFHILNICCCFLLLSTVEKIKTNIRNLTRPNSWATKDVRIEYLNEMKYSAFFTAVMDLFSCNVLRPGDWFVINSELGKVASYCASNGRKSNLYIFGQHPRTHSGGIPPGGTALLPQPLDAPDSEEKFPYKHGNHWSHIDDGNTHWHLPFGPWPGLQPDVGLICSQRSNHIM